MTAAQKQPKWGLTLAQANGHIALRIMDRQMVKERAQATLDHSGRWMERSLRYVAPNGLRMDARTAVKVL